MENQLFFGLEAWILAILRVSKYYETWFVLGKGVYTESGITEEVGLMFIAFLYIFDQGIFWLS